MSHRASIPLVGSAILAACAVASLPFTRIASNGWRLPRTPFDASASGNDVASGYFLLRRAEALLPRGASVSIRTEPPDPTRNAYLQRFGVALLPDARIVPAETAAPEFVVVVGARPDPAPGELLLELPEGSVWRRRP
ncbi:MAG TPA: hypothetical protein VGH97_17035 [Thermoanaerobaculia bacterium]